VSLVGDTAGKLNVQARLEYLMLLFLLLPAIAMAMLAWPFCRTHPVARPFAVAVIFGIGYWYVMPGVFFLLVPIIQGEDSYLLNSVDNTLHSIWLINSCLALLLLVAGLARCTCRVRYQNLRQELLYFPEPLVEKLLLATLVSASLLLTIRFIDLGPAFALQLLIGLASAREVMSFENISSSIGQSLIGLWELLTVFMSIFLSTIYVWLRRTVSISFVLACLSSVLVFASSGTRSVLLLLIFSIITAVISRPPAPSPKKNHTRVVRKRAQMLPTLLILGLCIIAGANMSARFANDSSQADYILLNSLGSHNDMFRELIYSITYGDSYQTDGWLFLETPITFAMPSFLGFSKTIPPHLIDFNLDRAGIDLLEGAGNVFPGLIADMYLCFGEFGPIIQALISALFLFLLWKTVLNVNKSAVGGALFVTLLSYYIISFRNLQGSLGILIILAFLLTRFVRIQPPRG